jgi:hypothetical protein
MNISLLDNSFSGSVSMSIKNLSIQSIDFLSKTVVVSQSNIDQNSSLIRSKIFIDDISLPILQINLS